MPNIVLVGAQWGDEGKGKVIDLLSPKADYIVRFQGGNNAGHTVVIGKDEFILHLIPSGILHKRKICVIANGVVVDPKALLAEIDTLRKKGIRVASRLMISDKAHVIFPYHKRLDELRELKKTNRLGTTKRGIGPSYADKVARSGIRMIDLLDESVLREKLKAALDEKNAILTKIYNDPGYDYNRLLKEYLGYGAKMKRYISDTARVLNEAVAAGKRMLFEGAQGALLDVDHGTYPFVTSNNTTSGGACTGTGVGPTKIDKVVGVVKAYTTRVGEGPFPTEFPEGLMKKIREKGREFGATTGRPRRCGWFDALIVRHSVMINGIDEIVVTKLDVLDDLDKIKICTAYRYKGKVYKEFPSSLDALMNCAPLYEELPGWKSDTTKVTRYGKLPKKAKDYLKRLSMLVKARIALISVGSERNQTFTLE